jgi:hypothetical protein
MPRQDTQLSAYDSRGGYYLSLILDIKSNKLSWNSLLQISSSMSNYNHKDAGQGMSQAKQDKTSKSQGENQ